MAGSPLSDPSRFTPTPGVVAYGFSSSIFQAPDAARSFGGPWTEAVLTESDMPGIAHGGWWITPRPGSAPETIYLRFRAVWNGLQPRGTDGKCHVLVPTKAYEGQFVGTPDDYYNGWILEPGVFGRYFFGCWSTGFIDGVWWEGEALGYPGNNLAPESPYPSGGDPTPDGGSVFVPMRLLDRSDAALASGRTYEVILQARYQPTECEGGATETTYEAMTGAGLGNVVGFYDASANCGVRGGGFHFG